MFRDWLTTTLTQLYPGTSFDVLVPPDPKMGDYSVNLAFVLAKAEKKNPRDVAQTIGEQLCAEGADMIERCEVAGPGFVNVYLKDAWLQEHFAQSVVAQRGEHKKVVIDCSAPNIAKPMHVGHLRSTIIGDALARVYTALGYDAIRWNYIGDWGTQFGRLIAAYKKYHESIENVDDLVKLYVRFHADMKEDPTLEDEGRAEFKKLESGDTENRELWTRFRAISMAEYQKTYDLLGIAFEVSKGESEYESMLTPLIDRLVATSIATPSEGALVVNLDTFSLPVALVQKSDGATLYLTRDIASLEDRIATYHPAKALYVVANEQALHFEQFFATVRKMGMQNLPELVHVKFGLVLGEDGKKFATREGNAVPLQQIIDEIIARATTIVRSKNSELSDDDVASIARVVGIGALKYNDLRQHPYTDITFNWDAMLDLGGNSGPYIQYTYARLANIAAKVGKVGTPDRALLVHPAERALMRHLLDFGYVIETCAHLSTLNALALYCYELAEIGNRFYEQVRINDDDNDARKSARLELIGAVTKTLQTGLATLGIQTLERI